MTRVSVDAFEDGAEVANNGDVFVRDKTHADGGTWQASGASAAWPVGSVFISVVATDPATLLGYGTWSAFAEGRVLLGNDGATYPTDEATGGATSTTHSHGYGSLYTDTIGNHSHAVGTIAAAAESTHTHGGGTLATNTQGAHQHTEGSLATAAEGAFHTHSNGSLAVDTHTSHAHGTATGDIKAGAVLYYNVSNKATPDVHAITGDTGTQSASHTHTISGYTTLNGDHTHFSFTGSSGAGSSHSHSMSGSTAADGGGHAHNVLGSTGSDATSVMQPYIVVHMWKRTA